MSRKSYGITREHGDALAEIRKAIEGGRLAVDPSAAFILADVEEAVRAHAKNGAIVRIRAKNLGTPPKEKMRRSGQRGTVVEEYVQQMWSKTETELLERLWDEGVSVQKIAERLMRTTGSVEHKIEHLGLYRTRARPRPEEISNQYTKRPLLLAARKIRERRLMDARATG